MFKKIIALLTVLMILFSSVPAMAAEQPVIFKDTITVTAEGGKYNIGFAEVEFKRNSLESSQLPITFDVKIYAENGIAYIEFSPDVPKFLKKVHIRVDSYKGLLYDRAKNKNIRVHIKKQHLEVDHFSRYAF